MQTLKAMQAFITNRRALNLRPKTIVWYSQLLKHFNILYPALPTTPGQIEEYLSHLVSEQQAEETVHNSFIVLKTFYRWAADRYHIKNPMVKLHAPRVTKKLRPTLEPDEVWKIISLARSLRDKAILFLLADNGIREGEICSLRKRDIKENTIQVVGKTGQRELPISDDTRRLLEELAEKAGPDDHLFNGRKGDLRGHSIYIIVHRYLVLAGINGPKLGPHRIRHAFGKGYLTAGGDLRSLQAIMGHASITTTQQYTALTPGDIINKHHQFNLLRSAKAAAQGSFLDKSGVLKEVEEILQNNARR